MEGKIPLESTRFRALQHRNFQLFIAGQLVSLIGTWMQSTAQLWLVYKLTNSAALLGVFGFANQVPILFLASIGGYVGDRYNRHKGVIWTQTASMILAFTLAGLTLTGAIHDARGAWVLIVIAFLVGIVNAFDVPIRQAFLVQMVGKEDLPNAVASADGVERLHHVESAEPPAVHGDGDPLLKADGHRLDFVRRLLR